ncbi:NAD(P)-binding protein [Aspergillus alliaceus]|uniref:NAD(P)-binding protein n=1 Tax=Petromyces alliaceus TaxID=209559 RepID=UPI0012A4F417|nr:NAD(P)-binding protein [Aspergillus alliaceus]KAB8234146.1 NAD(P)-binding protein [Aspergillus alliaceus]
MVKVAVAGGTGGLGRTIIEAILSTKKHEVYILSRRSNPAIAAELGVTVVSVDYFDTGAFVKALEDHQIHTIISTLSALSMTTTDGPSPELELIKAADISKTTKRIISNSWGIPYTEEHMKDHPLAVPKLQAIQALKDAKDLEGCAISNGYFLDYYGMPKVKSHMLPATNVVDIANDAAGIPGTGNDPVVFTHTLDVAKYVAAALELDKWDLQMFIIGDKVTFNEMVDIAQNAKGTKFNVSYDSIEKLRSGKVTELPAHLPVYQFFPKNMLQGFFSTFGLWFIAGLFDLKPAKTLNQIFPEIKPRTVRDVVEAGWKR